MPSKLKDKPTLISSPYDGFVSKEQLFGQLDLRAIDQDPDFKEDSVREVIILPILKELGYKQYIERAGGYRRARRPRQVAAEEGRTAESFRHLRSRFVILEDVVTVCDQLNQ